MLQNQQTLSYQTGYSFYSRVVFFFGLAILTSAVGTYTGFQYLAQYFLANPGLMWGLYALELILVFTSRIWISKRPVNYVLFTAFAFLTGLTIVPLLMSLVYEFGGFDLIIKALLSTTLVFSGTALFGWVTRKDLSGLSGFLWTGLIGIIIISIIHIFVPWSNTFEMIFAGFGVLLFSAFTMYDIQRIKSFPHDRALDAAMELYLDIFNLFVFILRLIAAGSRD